MSLIPAKDGGRSKLQSTKRYPRRFSPVRFTSDSARGEKLISPTSSCPRCDINSADTSKSPTSSPKWLEETIVTNTHSDALVFFGATGDLAYKKIFPALQAMLNRGHLNVPVIGVAKAGWTLDQLRARAHDSLEKHGGVDSAAFEKLSRLLRYVDGDYKDPGTFRALAKELKVTQRPAHYLAIPPTMFEPVLEQLEHGGCTGGAPRLLQEALRGGLQMAAHPQRVP